MFRRILRRLSTASHGIRIRRVCVFVCVCVCVCRTVPRSDEATICCREKRISHRFILFFSSARAYTQITLNLKGLQPTRSINHHPNVHSERVCMVVVLPPAALVVVLVVLDLGIVVGRNNRALEMLMVGDSHIR